MTEPNKMTIKPDGKMSIRVGADGVTTTSDQPVTMDLGHIKSVGVHNLVDVAEHTMSEQLGFVSHFFRFRDGGSLEFAFNGKGEILTLRGINVVSMIQNGNEVLFAMRPPKAPGVVYPEQPTA